jgi:hypothetical protein
MQDEFNSKEEALIDIQSGASKGYLVFPDNFTEHMKNRGLQRNFADNETLEGSTITFHMDYSGKK